MCSSTQSALHAYLKGVLGRLRLISFTNPSPCRIFTVLPLITLYQGHLEYKGGLSLIKPVFSGATYPWHPPSNSLIPLKMELSRKLKVFVFMTKSKKLKTPCGISYMCCACINPWVFYTEMLIIIIVLEHFYLPKRLPLHLLSYHGKRAMRENRSCSRKGKKNSNVFRKAPSFFIQTNFSWLQCGEKTSMDLPLFPGSCYKQTHKGHLSSTVLWRIEMKRWILRSWSFLFVCLNSYRSCSVKTGFLSLPLNGTCLLALWHHLRIHTAPLQVKVKSLQVSEGARVGFKMAFPFEAVESLIDFLCAACQHKVFLDKSKMCTWKWSPQLFCN